MMLHNLNLYWHLATRGIELLTSRRVLLCIRSHCLKVLPIHDSQHDNICHTRYQTRPKSCTQTGIEEEDGNYHGHPRNSNAIEYQVSCRWSKLKLGRIADINLFQPLVPRLFSSSRPWGQWRQVSNWLLAQFTCRHSSTPIVLYLSPFDGAFSMTERKIASAFAP